MVSAPGFGFECNGLRLPIFQIGLINPNLWESVVVSTQHAGLVIYAGARWLDIVLGRGRGGPVSKPNCATKHERRETLFVPAFALVCVRIVNIVVCACVRAGWFGL